MLVATGVLMLVTNDNRIPSGDRCRDHRMAVEKCGNPERQLTMAVLSLPHPARRICGQVEAGVVRAGNAGNQAVDRRNFHARAGALGAACEDRARRMGVRQDERALRARRCEPPRDSRRLVGVSQATISDSASWRW